MSIVSFIILMIGRAFSSSLVLLFLQENLYIGKDPFESAFLMGSKDFILKKGQMMIMALIARVFLNFFFILIAEIVGFSIFMLILLFLSSLIGFFFAKFTK